MNKFFIFVFLVEAIIAMWVGAYLVALFACFWVLFYQLERLIDKKTSFKIVINETTNVYEIKNKRKAPATIPEVHGKTKRTYPRNLQGRFAKAE